jgi:hypothetical protein
MDPVKIFYALSAGVGFLEFREGFRLLKSKTQLNSIDLSVGWLELFWLVICLFSLFYLDLRWQGSLLSGAFIAYAVVGVLLAFMFIQNIEIKEQSEIHIPAWVLKLSMWWGLFYSLASILLLFGSN